MYMAFDAMSYIEDAPKTPEEVQVRADKIHWTKAIQREITSIENNRMWTEVVPPDN